MKKVFLILMLAFAGFAFSSESKEVKEEIAFQADCSNWWYDHAYGTWQRTCVQGGGTIVCYDVMVCSAGACVIVSHTCCGIFGCS